MTIKELNPKSGDYLFLCQDGISPAAIIIFKTVRGGEIVAGATLINNEFFAKNYSLHNQDVRVATPEEKSMLDRAIAKVGMRWDDSRNRLMLIHEAQYGDFIRFTMDGKTGWGILKHVDEAGRVIMFSYEFDGGSVHYEELEDIGPVDKFTCSQMTSTDRKKYLDVLARKNKTWNIYAKRIEPLDIRAKKGETYHYLDDNFKICASTERFSRLDQGRYDAGNYFKDKDVAKRLQDICIASVTKLLAERDPFLEALGAES